MADKEKDEATLIDNIKMILGKEGKINDKVENGRGLERYAKDLLLLMSLVKDYYQGNYRDIPYKTISAAVVGLLYVLNPIDLIPDFIPFIGQVDDALVLKFCLKLMEKDLGKYKAWKDKQSSPKDANTKSADDQSDDQQSKSDQSDDDKEAQTAKSTSKDDSEASEKKS